MRQNNLPASTWPLARYTRVAFPSGGGNILKFLPYSGQLWGIHSFPVISIGQKYIQINILLIAICTYAYTFKDAAIFGTFLTRICHKIISNSGSTTSLCKWLPAELKKSSVMKNFNFTQHL